MTFATLGRQRQGNCYQIFWVATFPLNERLQLFLTPVRLLLRQILLLLAVLVLIFLHSSSPDSDVRAEQDV